MKTRKYSRVGYKCCDGNYYEDTYGRRITPVEVRELPLEELNSYQKRLIGALCRRFAAEGAERVTEELDKLQYCSLETALRVAQNGGYLPQETKEEATMPKAIMTEKQIIEMIGLYNGGMKPAKLAERYELDSGQVRNLLNKAKRNDKYKHLFTDKTEKTTEEQDKRFEEILDSVDAGAKKSKEPEQTDNDIDRAAEAIDSYLEEKKLTGDITEIEAQQEVTISAPTVFKATAEGLIEAVNGQVFVDNYNLIRAISEQLADNFVGNFYGRVEICFKILDRRDVFEFEIK